MFGDLPLSFREFAMGEKLPLATIHQAVLEFLRGRDDAVLFGAHAVNAYVEMTRMTEDVDVMSVDAERLAEQIRVMLNAKFGIAARVRTVRGGIGYRVYQLRKPKNRHLVDVRPVPVLPKATRVDDINVLSPAELIAAKLLSAESRGAKAKGVMDRADLYRLLATFPDLKTVEGQVLDHLNQMHADEKAIDAWRQLVATHIEPETDDDEFP
jgi:hypothetical protein